MKSEVTTYVEAAGEFGVTQDFMTIITRALRIEPKPVPRSPNAKGLDSQDMAKIRKSLGLRKGEKVSQRAVIAN